MGRVVAISGLLGVGATIVSAWEPAAFVRFRTTPARTFEMVVLQGGIAVVEIGEGFGVHRLLTSFSPWAEGVAPRADSTPVPQPTTRISAAFIERLAARYRDVQPIKLPPELQNATTVYWNDDQTGDLEERAGWPTLALAAAAKLGYRSDDRIVAARWGIPLPVAFESRTPSGDVIRRVPQDRLALLPCRPIWPGFAINTALYGAIAWTVLFARGTLRRFRRRRRNLCLHCGYNLRGLAPASPCPECGRDPLTSA